MLPSARAHSEERRRYANPNLENKAEGRGDQGCTNEIGPEELAWHPRWDEFHDCLSRRQVFRAKDGDWARPLTQSGARWCWIRRMSEPAATVEASAWELCQESNSSACWFRVFPPVIFR